MRIKVVTVVDRAGGAGGGERFALDVAMSLDPARFESIFCVTRPSEAATVATARAAGVRVLELERRSRLSLAPWAQLVTLLRSEQVDILHSHKFGSNAWASLVARSARVPVFVAQEHSWAFAGDRLRVFVDRHVVGPRADAIVAVSEHDRRAMIELERLDADRVVVCGNGVAPAASNSSGKLRAELGLTTAAPVIGLVGGLRPEKRVDVLITAAARLRRELPELVTVIVGDGPERPRLEVLAARLGVRDRVRFLGHRDDAVELAAGFDVAVLTSEREGCPLAVLEYMSLALPIVATRVGGIPSLVHDGIEALLVQEGNADAVASAVGLLLRNRRRASLLGAAAARRQAAEFGLDAAVGRLERLYERLLAGRCPA